MTNPKNQRSPPGASHFSFRLAAAAVLLLLSACVVVPKTVAAYDPECGRVARQVTLEPVELVSIGGCSNSGCVALVALAGVTAAASALVSGGIAVVSNVGYWVEERGSCRGGSATSGVPPKPAP